jgi:peptide/nickel transport system permease protein
VTGFLLIDSVLALDMRAFSDSLAHLVLPVVTLAILDFGAVARLIRGQMLEVMGEEYIRIARSTGLPERAVIMKHALRNALMPLITVLGVTIAQLLYGSVVIESLFAWPGMGNYVVGAIFALDFPVIMGFATIVSLAYVMVNAAVDLIHMALDPQVRANLL